MIYTANYSCAHDILFLIQIIKTHFYLLMGRQRLKLIDYIFFMLNGTVWEGRKIK